jgi:hypothetical protein
MNYTYTWANAEQTTIKRECAKGTCAFIPVDPANRDYAEFLEANVTPFGYVAPPAPPEPTPEEKLAAAGLTVDELKTLLGL